MTFSVGDHVLHPLHGAGTITSISVRQTDSGIQNYYALHLALDGAMVYIPVGCWEQVGLRPVCSRQEAYCILCGEIGVLPPQSPDWGMRYRANMERIRSGDIRKVAQVVCCLRQRNRRRPLAGSEKRMLEYAERILHSELMLAAGLSREEVKQRLEQLWKRMR